MPNDVGSRFHRSVGHIAAKIAARRTDTEWTRQLFPPVVFRSLNKIVLQTKFFQMFTSCHHSFVQKIRNESWNVRFKTWPVRIMSAQLSCSWRKPRPWRPPTPQNIGAHFGEFSLFRLNWSRAVIKTVVIPGGHFIWSLWDTGSNLSSNNACQSRSYSRLLAGTSCQASFRVRFGPSQEMYVSLGTQRHSLVDRNVACGMQGLGTWRWFKMQYFIIIDNSKLIFACLN